MPKKRPHKRRVPRRGDRVRVQWRDITAHTHNDDESDSVCDTFTSEWFFLSYAGKGIMRHVKLTNTFDDKTGKPYSIECIPVGTIIKLEVL